MQGLLVVLVIVLAVVSRPVEMRLWRAGKISDGMLAGLLIARFPIVVFLFGLISGASVPVLVALTAISVVPGLVFHRVLRDVIREQNAGR